jgi:uncharacterized protein (DUF58 family)
MRNDMQSIRRQVRGPDASESRATMMAEQKEQKSSWRRLKDYFGYGARRIDTSVQEQFNSAWIAMALLITLAGLIFRNPGLLAVAAILFTIVAASWLWNRLAFFGLRYEREFSEKRAFMGETIEVRVSLSNHKFLPLPWVTTSDVFPKELPVAETTLLVRGDTGQGELSNFWAVKWYDRATRTYHLKAIARGFHTFGPVDMETGDGFGMFRSARRQAGEQTLVVYPRILPLTSLGIPAKEPFGDRHAPRFMFEDPLRTVGVRDYRPEDDFRKVHWKASARRQRLQTRVLEPTNDINLMVCLNVQTVNKVYMGVIPEHLEKVVSIAASISYYALMQRWPTGLLANGALPHSDQSLKILPGRSPAQLTTILELLAAVTPFATARFHRLLAEESPHLPWGATLVIISSSLSEELAATLLDLKATGRRIVLITLDQRPLPDLLEGVIIYRVPEGALDELDFGIPEHGAEALLTPEQQQQTAIRNIIRK